MGLSTADSPNFLMGGNDEGFYDCLVSQDENRGNSFDDGKTWWDVTASRRKKAGRFLCTKLRFVRVAVEMIWILCPKDDQ